MPAVVLSAFIICLNYLYSRGVHACYFVSMQLLKTFLSYILSPAKFCNQSVFCLSKSSSRRASLPCSWLIWDWSVSICCLRAATSARVRSASAALSLSAVTWGDVTDVGGDGGV